MEAGLRALILDVQGFCVIGLVLGSHTFFPCLSPIHGSTDRLGLTYQRCCAR